MLCVENEVFWEEGTWCVRDIGCQHSDFLSAWQPGFMFSKETSPQEWAEKPYVGRARNAGVSWDQTKRLKQHQELELLGGSGSRFQRALVFDKPFVQQAKRATMAISSDQSEHLQTSKIDGIFLKRLDRRHTQNLPCSLVQPVTFSSPHYLCSSVSELICSHSVFLLSRPWQP